MNYIRTILTLILIPVILVLSLPVLLIAQIVRIFDKFAGARIAQWLIKLQARFIMFMSGSKVEVRGRENVPDGAVLFTSNHRSYFDTVMAYAYCDKDLLFVGKKEVMKIPYINWCMTLTNGLFIDRDDIRQGLKVILSAIDYVKDGVSVWICPEGTRVKSGPCTNLLPWKHGSFKVALKSGCPIVPVALYNTREVFEDHLILLEAKHVVMEYLPAIYPEKLTLEEKKNIDVIVREQVKEKLEELTVSIK